MAHRFGGSQARRRLEELRSGWALDLALRPACFPPDPLPLGADRVTSMHGNWGTDGDYLRIAGDTFLSLEGPGLERPARRMAGCWHCAVAWTETRAGPRRGGGQEGARPQGWHQGSQAASGPSLLSSHTSGLSCPHLLSRDTVASTLLHPAVNSCPHLSWPKDGHS